MMINPTYVGKKKNLALFEYKGKAVFVNTQTLTASVVSADEARDQSSGRGWDTSSNPDPIWKELASVSLSEQSVNTTTLAQGRKRIYTVPTNVRNTALAAKSSDTKFSAVTQHVNSLLTDSKQVSCEDVLWISRFFDSNTENSSQTDIGTTSVWQAWGGEPARQWSQSLAAKLDYDSVLADAGTYETPGVALFLEDSEDEYSFWTEPTEDRGQFVKDLYVLTPHGTWMAWGNGDWLECEAPERTAKFIELDSEAAIYIAGSLFDAPETLVDLRTPNPDAWDLAQEAYEDVDWEFVDRLYTPNAINAAASPVEQDYTPEERSKNASGQLRDANGRFAEIGASGAIKSSGLGGIIKSADQKTGIITVEASDGSVYNVPSKDFEVGAAPHPKVDPEAAKETNVDFSGIVAPIADPVVSKARLSEDIRVLTPAAITAALDKYADRISRERLENSKKFNQIVAAASSSDAGADVPPASADPTPDDTDVNPIYIAIVEKNDPRTVTDLVALVPATATSSDPKTFRRVGGKWVEDSKILADIRSATPPPVVQLNAEQYQDVLQQVDFTPTGEETPVEESPLTAAGGADRNRGNAEVLRRYWTVGPGGLKIRWGTGGQYKRCVRLLSKYLGERSHGYCALRYKEMNAGRWPGDHRNRELSTASVVASGISQNSTNYLLTSAAVIRASAAFAAAEVAKSRVYNNAPFEPVVPSAEDITEERSGKAFCIPLLLPEGIETGDGRTFAKGSVGMRNLPLPLMWQPATGDGHDTSYIVGRIDRIDRIDGGLGNAYGVFDTGPYGKEAQRLVENKMLRWVSADLDKFEVDENKSDEESGKMFVKKGRVMGATLVAKPAFQEVIIQLVSNKGETMADNDATEQPITASAAIAASIPVEPPRSWFEDPKLTKVTPISISDNGRIYGHLAAWDSVHIGMAGAIHPPRNSTNYAYFNKGVLRTAEGVDVRVGQFTLVGGHAPVHLNASAAVKHYDDTNSAYADVHVGEDNFGIWFSGALRPRVTPEQIRNIRASALSGDWRPINHRHELIATCSVNVPGFQMLRTLAASASQDDYAIVAAGIVYVGGEELDVETPSATELAENARALIIDSYVSQFKDFSDEKREKLAKKGSALLDGSYPIETVADLRNAIMAYGRADQKKRAAVRRHIVKRARALGKADLIPENWKELALDNQALSFRDRYDELVALTAAAKQAELQDRVAALKERIASE